MDVLGIIKADQSLVPIVEELVGNDQIQEIDGVSSSKKAIISPKISFKDKLTGKEISKEDSSNYHIWFNPNTLFDMSMINIEPPKLDRPYPRTSIKQKFKERLESKWKSSLIVKLFGRSIGYNAILNILQQLWKPEGDIELIDLGAEYFLVVSPSTN